MRAVAALAALLLVARTAAVELVVERCAHAARRLGLRRHPAAGVPWLPPLLVLGPHALTHARARAGHAQRHAALHDRGGDGGRAGGDQLGV
jgi:hypothetical protein